MVPGVYVRQTGQGVEMKTKRKFKLARFLVVLLGGSIVSVLLAVTTRMLYDVAGIKHEGFPVFLTVGLVWLLCTLIMCVLDAIMVKTSPTGDSVRDLLRIGALSPLAIALVVAAAIVVGLESAADWLYLCSQRLRATTITVPKGITKLLAPFWWLKTVIDGVLDTYL